ncbi:MAG: type II CRISPR-associated endonuclease Cas1 [Bacteroidales bacterium]|nr:type II CRISPR-associated endonuclease Cas1 [Candidatus Colimorpha onthohippi]
MIKKTLAFMNPAQLSLQHGQMVVRQGDGTELVRTIPIEDIGVVLLESQQISITAPLLDALVQNNSAVITCNDRFMPSGLLMPIASNSLQSERFQHQIEASVPLRKQLWMQTIRAKIMGQAAMLQRHNPQQAKPLMVMADSVRSGDPDNREAQAAAHYWKYIFKQFPSFVRDRNGEMPNPLLNYGYAILRSVVARSLVGSGLLPTLGIHHHNRYNAYCLADDIMEPYRPVVDNKVVSILQQQPHCEELTTDIKRQLLTIPVEDVTIDGKSSPLMVAATLTTASLARCYAGQSRQILYPSYNPNVNN